MPGYLKSNDDIQKEITFVYAKRHLPYLFGYKLILAISRDPKLLTQKIDLINTNCKGIIPGYKPRAIFGLAVYRRPWNFCENTKWQWLYSEQ